MIVPLRRQQLTSLFQPTAWSLSAWSKGMLKGHISSLNVNLKRSFYYFLIWIYTNTGNAMCAIIIILYNSRIYTEYRMMEKGQWLCEKSWRADAQSIPNVAPCMTQRGSKNMTEREFPIRPQVSSTVGGLNPMIFYSIHPKKVYVKFSWPIRMKKTYFSAETDNPTQVVFLKLSKLIEEKLLSLSL